MKSWFLRHGRSILLAFVLLSVMGVVAAFKLPVGLFPLIDFPRVEVNLDAGDQPVDRMVVEVTRPLELVLRSVPGVLGVRSDSSRGSTQIFLTFDWGTDMVAALLQTQAMVGRVLPTLPPGTRFEARRMDPTVFPVLGLSLTGGGSDIVALSDFATYRMAPALSAVSGVAQVEVLGGRQAEYQIIVDPARLSIAGIGTAEVAAAVAASNVVAAVGRVEDRYRLYLTLSESRLHDESDIRGIVVKNSAGGIIKLEDIATIRLGMTPAWTRVNANGHEAVLVNIKQQRGANSVTLVQAVKNQLAELNSSLPSGAKVSTYYDQSELIVASAGSVRDAILIGAVFAGLVLFGFLRLWRVTLVVALILPAVLLATIALLYAANLSFNIMTLGGMAAAVGLIVDDAVVMLEHGMRRVTERAQAAAATPEATADTLLVASIEMFKPLTGSSLATVLVFVPLAFLSGVAGAFFKSLALTMAASLTISYICALLVVPVLMRHWVRLEDAVRNKHSGKVFVRIQAWQSRVLGSLLQRSWPAYAAVVILIIGGVVGYTRVETGFMPHMDEGGFVLDYKAAPGTSVQETDRLLRQVETLVLAVPEVDSYSRRTGLQLGAGLTEANEGDFFIKLKGMPRRAIDEVMSDLRERIQAEVPGLRVETAQLMEDLVGDLIASPKPIEVKVFGADDVTLRRVADNIAKQIEKDAGVVEVVNGVTIAGDALEIHVDGVRAAVEGLDAQGVTDQVANLLEGKVATTVQRGEKLLGVRIWTGEDARARLEQVKTLRIRTASGQIIPLSRVAEVAVVQGQPQIARDNLRQMVAVTGRLEGVSLGTAMTEVKQTVAQISLPRGVYVEYGGLYNEQQSSMKQLAMIFVAAVLLVAVLLCYLYESWAIVGAIIVTSLLSAVGVFVGLWVTGTELNLASMMGLTMIIGIVTEIAIFYFAELENNTEVSNNHLIEAGRLRLRPILMTSIIAILALSPLALRIGAGSAMQQPLAIAIISGLLFGVPLVLLVMPVVYRRFSYAVGTNSASS